MISEGTNSLCALRALSCDGLPVGVTLGGLHRRRRVVRGFGETRGAKQTVEQRKCMTDLGPCGRDGSRGKQFRRSDSESFVRS